MGRKRNVVLTKEIVGRSRYTVHKRLKIQRWDITQAVDNDIERFRGDHTSCSSVSDKLVSAVQSLVQAGSMYENLSSHQIKYTETTLFIVSYDRESLDD
jgi:hypothetical protein